MEYLAWIIAILLFFSSVLVSAGSVNDTSNADFAQGTHENTENLNDAVRLKQGENRGHFTSRVFDIFLSTWDNITWTENEPSTIRRRVENVDNEPNPLSDAILARQGTVVGGSIQDVATEDNVYENIAEDSGGIIQWEHRIENVSTTFDGYGFDDYVIKVKGYTSGDSEAVDVYILRYTGAEWVKLDNLTGEEKTIEFTISGELINDYLYEGGISLRYSQSTTDLTQTVVHIDLSVVEKTITLKSEVKLQVRVSDDNVNWSEWKGPDNTPSTFFTNGSGTGYSTLVESLENIPRGAYIQYRAYFSNQISDLSGENGPMLYDVTITYTLPSPTLLSPVDNWVTSNTKPTFDWADLKGADYYNLQVDDDQAFASPEVELGSVASEVTLAQELPEGLYFWRVKGWNNVGWSSLWSEPWRIRVDTTPPAAPNLYFPGNGLAENVDGLAATVILEWYQASDVGSWISGYTIQVDDGSSFASPILDENVVENTLAHTFFSGLYYWRVRARDNAGNIGGWSEIRWFMVQAWKHIESWSASVNASSRWQPAEIWTGNIFAESVPPSEFVPPPPTTGSFTDNADENFVLGAHENTEGLGDDVRLIQGYTSGHFISQTFHIYRARWDNLVWGENEPTISNYSSSVKLQVSVTLDDGTWSEWKGPDNTPNTYFEHPPVSLENIPISDDIRYIVYLSSENSELSGENGPLLHYVTINYTRLGPTLLSPKNGENTNDVTPTFDWEDFHDAMYYTVQASRNPNFIHLEIEIDVAGTSEFTPVDGLLEDYHYWRVKAWNGAGEDSAWSAIRWFTVDVTPPAAPLLISPEAGHVRDDTTITLTWGSVDEISPPVMYNLQIATEEDFISILKNIWAENTGWTGSLASAYTYRWRVRVRDNAGNIGEWSEIRWFRIRGFDSFETWTGAVIAQAEWYGAETWGGTVVALVEWHVVESWTGTVVTHAEWYVAESWTGIVRTETPAWYLVEPWSGSINATTGWCLAGSWSGTVDAPVHVPALLSPLDQAQTNDNSPFFDWENYLVADNFQFQLDNETTFSSPWILNQTVAVSEYNLGSSTLSDGVYYWRVNQTKDGLTGPWSDVWTLRIDTIEPMSPQLVFPKPGENIGDNTPLLRWGEVPENSFPLTYEVHVWIEPDFYGSIVWENTTDENYQVTNLLVDGFYYWRVRVWDASGNAGDWSSSVFRVDTVPPDEPYLLWPADGTEINDTTLTFDWNPVKNEFDGSPENSLPILYYVAVSDNPDFSYETFNSGWIKDDNWTLSPLLDGAHYWRVRARDNAGNVSENSITRWFRVATPPEEVDEGPAGGGVLPPPDTVPPEMEVLEPVVPEVGSDFTVKVRITDASGVNADSIEAFLDNVLISHTWADNIVTIELVGLSAGSHAVAVKASDWAGNENSVLVRFTVVLENVQTENVAPSPERVALRVRLEVPTEGDGTAKVEDGAIRVTLVLMNHTEDFVVRRFKMIFAETILFVETEVGPRENVEFTVFLSVEGVEPGTYTISVVDTKTNEIVSTKVITLAAAVQQERQEVVPVAPPPLNISYLMLAMLAIGVATVPLGVAVRRMRRSRVLDARAQEATRRVKYLVERGIRAWKAERATARVTGRLLQATKPPKAEDSTAWLPAAKKEAARVKHWFERELESIEAERVTARVKSKLMAKYVKSPRGGRAPPWFADAREEARRIVRETREEYLRRGMDPDEVERVVERMRRRLMLELKKRREMLETQK